MSHKCVLIIIVAIICCIIAVSAITPMQPPEIAGVDGSTGIIKPVIPPTGELSSQESNSVTIMAIDNGQTPSENTSFIRGLMHFTEQELREMDAARASLPMAASFDNVVLPKASKSLLSSVPYIGSNRDQGYCGNCWVWASTGALEIDHIIKNQVKDRLSIQYFNSNWNGGAATGNACLGGWPYKLADYYSNTLKKVIPWSNTNASYADYNYVSGPSGISAAYISTNPNYPIINITDQKLEVHNGQTAAINTIKGHINGNTPVLWYYALPSTGWTAFNNFWKNQDESAVWDPDPYAGTVLDGAHEVLIIGYDDTGSSPHWIVLNSWGINSGRPNGLFRVKMNMNYDAQMTYGGYTQYAHRFDIFNSVYKPTPTPTPTITPTSTPTVTPTQTPIPEYGNLTVTSTPSQAAISIDKDATGFQTPATIQHVSTGAHILSLEKQGYATYTQSFSIISNQTTFISAVLSQTGTLSVSSRPKGAQIWIDDVDTGKVTPSTFRTLSIGTHTIKLVKAGYSDYTQTITIQIGKTSYVNGILTSTGGSISVTSSPSGASLFIDGTDTGYQTPNIISGLSAGYHTILLKKNGYLDWTKQVFVNAKMTTSVHAGLISGGTNGSVFVYSNPSGAMVFIDTQNSGFVTPKTITGIPAGQHTISLNLTGYRDWSKSTTVRSGVKTTVYGRMIQK